MAIHRYTREELLYLRNSPLVQKPENLPAIEQWLDEVQQNARSVKSPAQSKPGGETAQMGNFTRPSLAPLASRMDGGEGISLGPPRTMFPSSRNVTKLSDFGDKSSSNDAAPADEHDSQRSRFFGERQAGRKSLNEKDIGNNRESWTTSRDRKPLGVDDADGRERIDRSGRRERNDETERRNGFGEKLESRWGERRPNGERQGGWRDRERHRREPDWMSGLANEKDPEWMDDSPAAGEDDLRTIGMSKKAEDFQRWKDERKLKETVGSKKIEEAEEVPPEPPAAAKEPPPAKPTAALKLDGLGENAFNWTEAKPSGSAVEAVSTPGKPAAVTSKTRSSRFASMFKESQAKEDVDIPVTKVERPIDSAEDEAGFKRILQMLGSTGVNQPAAEEVPSSPPTKSMKQKSRFTGFFDQTPKSPERLQSPQSGSQEPFRINQNDGLQQSGRSVMRDNPSSAFGGKLPETQPDAHQSRIFASGNVLSPEPTGAVNGIRDPSAPRATATPDISIQNLLASQRSQKTQGPDKNSEFLLNLLQNKTSRPPSQQAHLDNNFPLWVDQPPSVPEPHAPKPRALPPPGFFEDQLLRNHPQEPQRQEQQSLQTSELSQRHQPRPAPPGFYDEHNVFLQHHTQQQQGQRRNFAESTQHLGRRIGGLPNLPQMQIPTGNGQFNSPPPEFLQSPVGHQQPPPPGFNPHMPRHPPGFHSVPVPFQQTLQSRDMIQPGPPGFQSGGGMMQTTSPPNAPPGFYGGGAPGLPPGFTQMRSPNESISNGMRGGMRGFDGGFDGIGGGLSRR